MSRHEPGTLADVFDREERKPRDTGAAALAALALCWPDMSPREAMRGLLSLFEGNTTTSAKKLGVGRKSLASAITALDLDWWLAERWPNRANGGQGARLGRAASTAKNAKQAQAMRIATRCDVVVAGRNVLDGSRYTVNRSTIDALVRSGKLVLCLSTDGGMAARLAPLDLR